MLSKPSGMDAIRIPFGENESTLFTASHRDTGTYIQCPLWYHIEVDATINDVTDKDSGGTANGSFRLSINSILRVEENDKTRYW